MLTILIASAVAAMPLQSRTLLDPKLSSAIANYLLIDEACRQMGASSNSEKARVEALDVLQTAGFNRRNGTDMIDRLVEANLARYVAAMQDAANGSDEAIAYYCSSMIPLARQKLKDLNQTMTSKRSTDE